MTNVITGADEQIVGLCSTGTIRVDTIRDLTNRIDEFDADPDVIPVAVYVREDDQLVPAALRVLPGGGPNGETLVTVHCTASWRILAQASYRPF